MSFLTGMFGLAGRRALVTGSRRGIGQAIAVGLAQAGAEVVLAARGQAPDETLQQITAAGGRASHLELDLGDVPGIEERLPAFLAETPVDIVVNNAGVIRRSDFVEGVDQDWEEVLTVNLHALSKVCLFAGRQMTARGSGKIINIASLLSFQGGLRVASYAAAKHGVLGLTRALSNEWAPLGVQVNAIAPGYIATDNTAPLRADTERSESILSRIPAGRWGAATDLVGAAVFLAGRASDYVTGEVLTVDGGWMAR